ncbi:hypothetical protein Scep_024162 [Stephania cephalantha]|uniref:Uncharacterized protein n=1 Tax=Stephania cephalantha TaxID=152367 RepID=A0AAP0EYW8_9MAGN
MAITTTAWKPSFIGAAAARAATPESSIGQSAAKPLSLFLPLSCVPFCVED